MYLRVHASSLLSAVIIVILLAASVSAAPARADGVGLVIGNADYASLPPLPVCAESSQAIADGLRRLGYRVIDRKNLSSGGMAGAIGEFGNEAAATPTAGLFIYFCGYASGMNNRAFLLPASANIRRPSDVMTQGILAKALLDVLVRHRSGNDSAPVSAIVALDVFAPIDTEAPVLRSLTDVALPAGAGLVAVVNSSTVAGPAALSAALSDGLAEPGVESGPLLSGVQARLTDAAISLGALRMPSVSSPLVAVAPSPVPTSLDAVEAGPSQIPDDMPIAVSDDVQLAEPTPSAPSALDSAPDADDFPDEQAMTMGERRRVQLALAAIGYYSGAIDGLFGPETRAAIRRFQHEIDVEMTGVITGAQAARLFTRQ